MDFNRSSHVPASNADPASGSNSVNSGVRRSRPSGNNWGRIGVVVGVAAVAVLLLSVVSLLVFGQPKQQDKYVDSNRLQAVFLNTGQVYFGNIKALNNRYFVLKNIYYLQTSGNTSGAAAANAASPSVSLVKLGCELHEPLDQMVINSDQVTFWENLGEKGQVASAVEKFEKANPDGQKCADQSSSASPDSGSTTQNAPTSSTPAKPSTTNP